MKWLTLGISLILLGLTQGRDKDDLRVVVARSTKTAVILTTSTLATPFTCAFASLTGACQRRRYRRFMPLSTQDLEKEEPVIEGSMDEELDRTIREATETNSEPGSDRDPRIAFTVWTTISSTFTITTTSTNTATTFSLSFFCSVQGANFPPACG